MAVARKFTKFTPEEINILFKQAKRCLRHHGFDVLLARNNKSYGRILVITPKKIGEAFQRIRIRRIFKVLFSEKYTQLPYDCIIIAKTYVLEQTTDSIRQLLEKAYETAAIL